MAERALPPVVPPSPEPASSAVSTAFGSPLEPVALPPPRKQAHDTYVVQVQKDQIYRVPPPENAYLAERYRNERAGGGKRGGGGKGASPCSPCVLRTLGAVLAAALLLGAAVVISVVVLRPHVPSFNVDRLSVHNASRQQHMDYDFFLTAVNPNKMTALWYKDGGTARLLHQGTTLAKGNVGEPAVGGEDATDFSVLLHGLQHDGHTPKAVEKGLKGSKDAVALQLSVEVAVQVHIGALGFGQRRLAVDCEISAAGLRKDVHISSQKCKSTFGN
ncbi:NDR1/HIN1-like protein 13 [Phragmites australis]|uniref:NDR1/HIN1-like protein 13 n=1 Tax=Phragmites australis TaxID=29695 RepID=UPI002D767636|nr:NDR1/HIN1-like protein 13 [Phragmites australis]